MKRANFVETKFGHGGSSVCLANGQWLKEAKFIGGLAAQEYMVPYMTSHDQCRRAHRGPGGRGPAPRTNASR